MGVGYVADTHFIFYRYLYKNICNNMKFLRRFANHYWYKDYAIYNPENFVKPNVSVCVEEKHVHFMSKKDPPLYDDRIIAVYNVNSITSGTKLINVPSAFTQMEVDGVKQPSVVSVYTFNTTGNHTVKYVMKTPTEISNTTFSGCTRLTSITIPSGVTSIGSSAFNSCTSLTNIDIPDSITSIGIYAFNGCYSLTSITIPSDVTRIGNNVFQGCTSLTSVTVNATTPPTLGSRVFDYTNNCPIYVPTCSLVSTYQSASGWSSYSSRIFSLDCPALTATFNVTSTTNPTMIASGTSSFSKIEIDDVVQPSVTTGYTFSTTGEHTVKYHLKSTSIGTSAFTNCTNLTSIEIPDSVTNIGESTFQNCSSLTSCTIGSGVTSIGQYVFSNCSSLTSITIPNSVTSIDSNAFIYCTNLQRVVIPSSVTYIGDGAFCRCHLDDSSSAAVEEINPNAKICD